MRFPLVSRSHHEDMVSELRAQIAEKDSERKKYLDILGQMGWGRRVFEPEQVFAQEEETAPSQPMSYPARRPSEIVKAQNFKAIQAHEEKNGQRRREQVLEMVRLAADPGNPQATQ